MDGGVLDNKINTVPRVRVMDPAPQPGLHLDNFRRLCENGFGDGHNSFAHSMAWFRDRLYVGTTRSNFQMVKIQTTFRNLPVHMWPVEGPDDAEGLYKSLDRRSQIWEYTPKRDRWMRVFRAPLVPSVTGKGRVARETGFRAMAVYQGRGDPAPALYAATWAVSRSPGALLLRSEDGRRFKPVSPYGIITGLPVTATRVLVPFNGKLYTSPTGTRGYDTNFVINVSGHPVIYETEDPAQGQWLQASKSGFGDPSNDGVFMLCPFNGSLYAGTFNCQGYQVWRSKCSGKPPYRWTKVIDKGAYRGATNQIVTSMREFKGALYVGSGIQNGGFDRVNNIGPAGSELIRIWPDDSWDLVVGEARDTPDGKKIPLSGMAGGFGNLFNGYFWVMEEHDNWLYLGTMDSTIWVYWLRLESYPERARRLIKGIGVDNILENEAGCDLWRSSDGANWIPVTRTGFDNHYNLGVRNLISTPYGLFVGVANVFGPRVATRESGVWEYVDNPRGGLEVWLGAKGQHSGQEHIK